MRRSDRTPAGSWLQIPFLLPPRPTDACPPPLLLMSTPPNAFNGPAGGGRCVVPGVGAWWEGFESIDCTSPWVASQILSQHKDGPCLRTVVPHRSNAKGGSGWLELTPNRRAHEKRKPSNFPTARLLLLELGQGQPDLHLRRMGSPSIESAHKSKERHVIRSQ